jgi:hypothetical protein
MQDHKLKRPELISVKIKGSIGLRFRTLFLYSGVGNQDRGDEIEEHEKGDRLSDREKSSVPRGSFALMKG